MIAVLDTNVLIAALATEGICYKLLLRARRKDFSLVTSSFILSEVRRVLTKKFHASKEETASAIRLIREATDQVVIRTIKIERTCRDADDDDDAILACAHTAKADYLVTGDNDLLVINKFKDIAILLPRDFELLFA